MEKSYNERPWGNFTRLTLNEKSTVKIIDIKPNAMLSLQYHEKRSEYWKVVTGDAIAVLEKKTISLHQDDEIMIPQGAKHRLIGGKNGARILEIAFGDFDEADIVRIEDIYGRSQ